MELLDIRQQISIRLFESSASDMHLEEVTVLVCMTLKIHERVAEIL